jgi:hypothetical protein
MAWPRSLGKRLGPESGKPRYCQLGGFSTTTVWTGTGFSILTTADLLVRAASSNDVEASIVEFLVDRAKSISLNATWFLIG